MKTDCVTNLPVLTRYSIARCSFIHSMKCCVLSLFR